MPNRELPKRLHRRLEALLWRLRATRRIWRPGARAELAPNEPAAAEAAQGHLDPPANRRVVGRQPITFHGWVHFRSGPTSRVEIWLGSMRLGAARLGVPRADVNQALELPPAEAPGFELTANLERWPYGDGEASLRAVATSVAGETHEIEPVTVKVVSAKTEGPVRPPERTPPARNREGLRTLVVTHQLDLGGAQLYLNDLLGELTGIGAVNPTVVTAKDGPLRAELEELGIPIHVSGVPATGGLSSHLGRVEELAAWIDERDFQVAFVNTATTLAIPGIEAARRLRLPTVWAIHESYEPAELWQDVDPAVRGRAEVALAGVEEVLFVADATRRLFEPAIGRNRGLTIPYGLDLTPIDSRRTGFDAGAARRRAGVPPDAEVVLCVGSIEPRKAQLPLVQAFALVADRHPRARLAVVGGRNDAYSDFLETYAASTGAGDRISIVPMTPDVQPWFGLSDLVACPSDVESMPRTVLEAMAWETPVLATSVFGLPELIEHGETGWLCEPRDLTALAKALDQALGASPEERRRIGRAGRELVESRHSLEDYGREIAALLERVAAGPRALQPLDAAAG